MFECTCTSIHHRAISSHNDVDGFVRLNLVAFSVEVYFHNYTLQGYSCILWVWTCDPGCIVEQFMISISFPLYMINICKPPQSWRRWQLTEKEFCFFLNENSRNLSFPLYLPCAFLVLLSLSSSSLPCVSVVFGVWRQSGGTDPAAHLKFIWSPPRERGESLHFKEIASTFWSAWHTVKHTVHTHIFIYIFSLPVAKFLQLCSPQHPVHIILIYIPVVLTFMWTHDAWIVILIPAFFVFCFKVALLKVISKQYIHRVSWCQSRSKSCTKQMKFRLKRWDGCYQTAVDCSYSNVQILYNHTITYSTAASLPRCHFSHFSLFKWGTQLVVFLSDGHVGLLPMFLPHSYPHLCSRLPAGGGWTRRQKLCHLPAQTLTSSISCYPL